MLPDGIIASAGLLGAGMADAVASGCVAVGSAAVGAGGLPGAATGCVVMSGRAGSAAGAFVERVREGRRGTEPGVCVVGVVCAQRSRPVKNRIRKSVVVFILLLRLGISNCSRARAWGFSGSWRRG